MSIYSYLYGTNFPNVVGEAEFMEVTCIEEFPQEIHFRVFSKEEKFAVLEFAKTFTGRPLESHIKGLSPEEPLDEDQHIVMEAIAERKSAGYKYSKITTICDITKFDETKVAKILAALEKHGKIVNRKNGYGLGGKRGRKAKG